MLRNGLLALCFCVGCSAPLAQSSEATAAKGEPVLAAAASGQGSAGDEAAADRAWIGSWVSSQQLTEPKNLPPAPGFPGATLRQVVQLGIGGEKLRLTFSNLFGQAPLTIERAVVALAREGSAVDVSTNTQLSFGGSLGVTIPAGETVTSDAIARHVDAFTNLAVSMVFEASPPTDVTGHPGSRTTSFLQPGDVASQEQLSAAVDVEHWYFLSGIDVFTSKRARAVVTLGDSITDGRGSTTNHNDRWPNQLGHRLLGRAGAAPVVVLNQGIGGNRVLEDGLGPSAVSRFERDALGPPGVHWVVILEGINDLGTAVQARAEGRPAIRALDLIGGYRRMIASAHERDVRVYGATILPYAGAAYFSAEGEADRQAVNAWMRTGGELDGVIDFDAIARDPAAPTHLSVAVDGGDHLHPSAAGYAIMAGAIDLHLFD